MSFTYEVYPFKIAGATMSLDCIAFNKDSDICVCAGRSGNAHLLSTDNWSLLGNYIRDSSVAITKVGFSEDSRFVYTFSNVDINFYETVTGRLLASLPLPEDSLLATGCAINEDFTEAVIAYKGLRAVSNAIVYDIDLESALASSQPIVIDRESYTMKKAVPSGTELMNASSNLERFYVAAREGSNVSVFLLDSEFEVIEEVSFGTTAVTQLKLNRDCGILSVTLENGMVELLDASTLETLSNTKTHARYIACASVHPVAEFFAAGGGIKAIDAAREAAREGEYDVGLFNIDGQILATFDGAAGTVNDVMWSEDGLHLCAVTHEGIILAWNFQKAINSWKME